VSTKLVDDQPRPRGRPRKGVKPARRVTGRADPKDEILKVSASLFSLKGFAGTTMAEIADTVGVRGPSMYYHFRDKAEILRALAAIILDEAITGSHKWRREGGVTVPHRLYRLIYDLVYRLRVSPYELNCMFDPSFHSDEFKDVNVKLQEWQRDLRKLVELGVKEGSFWDQDSKLATLAIRGLIESAIRQLGGHNKLSPQESAAYVAEFAIRGLLSGEVSLDSVLAEVNEEQS
jgi:TetR/AcrR family transcriptional regulator